MTARHRLFHSARYDPWICLIRQRFPSGFSLKAASPSEVFDQVLAFLNSIWILTRGVKSRSANILLVMLNPAIIRADMPPIAELDVATMIRRILRESDTMNQLELAKVLSKSRSWVTVELLGMPERTIRRLIVKEPENAARLAGALGFRSIADMVVKFNLQVDSALIGDEPAETLQAVKGELYGRFEEVRVVLSGSDYAVQDEALLRDLELLIKANAVFVLAPVSSGAASQLGHPYLYGTPTRDVLIYSYNELNQGNVGYRQILNGELQVIEARQIEKIGVVVAMSVYTPRNKRVRN
jgi:hypothetical protein